MDELRLEFLNDAIPKLKKLQSRLANAELSGEFERDIFRTLHTLKGTSQTFGLNTSGKLAHEIENLLQAKRDDQFPADKNFTQLLAEGINLLRDTFQNARDKKEILFPADYVKKIHASIPQSATQTADNLSGIVPPAFLKQLSAQEKESLRSATANGNLFYLIEVGFDFASFAAKFKELKLVLNEHGEAIANFPSPKFAAENKIGFQIFFVSTQDENNIREIIEPFGAKLILQEPEKEFSNDLKGVLEHAVASGKKASLNLEKQVEFKIAGDDIEPSNDQLKLISGILLHLVRNAVDHAIEKRGKIKIEMQLAENNLLLRVADDGRGIDAEKIRARAVAKNLISADENLSKENLLKLIFAHGFSTAETVSEISGRGVGLDIVEEAVKQADGEIRVESEVGKGTIFEIRLPQES